MLRPSPTDLPISVREETGRKRKGAEEIVYGGPNLRIFKSPKRVGHVLAEQSHKDGGSHFPANFTPVLAEPTDTECFGCEIGVSKRFLLHGQAKDGGNGCFLMEILELHIVLSQPL